MTASNGDKAGVEQLADEIERRANSGTRWNNEETGEYVRNHLTAILAALRAQSQEVK